MTEPREAAAGSANTGMDGSTRPVTLPRVLILDDDSEAWSPIVRTLRSQGVGALVCGANPSATDLVVACEAEVVIVETRPTPSAAFDLLSRLKTLSPHTELVMTAVDPSALDVISAYRAGASEVITKPFHPSDMTAAILRAVDKRTRAKDTAALLEEGQRLLTVRERERLPALAVDLARRAMQADVVSLMLKDTAGRLYIAHAHGLPPELLAGTRLHIGQRVAGRVAELRAPVLIDDALRRDERFEALVPFGRVRSSIVHPLLAGDRVLGVLNIGRSTGDQPFNRDDVARAGLVAERVALAFESLRQWQRTGMADRLAIVGQVAGSVAHEINNPLAAIVGQTDLALESVTGLLARLRPSASLPADDLRRALLDVRERLADAREAAAGVEVVASDLRSAVQGDGTEEALSNLAETIRAATRLATTDVRRQTKITRDVEPSLVVAGDSGLLCQVFLNLILNANQALRMAGTSNPEIKIASSRSSGEIRVDVIDNGPGVAPEHLARMFEPFFTDLPRRLRPGLGLSIAHDIVQGLGGRIDVTATPGDGTVFSIYLPSAATSDEDHESARRPHAGATLPIRHPQSPHEPRGPHSANTGPRP